MPETRFVSRKAVRGSAIVAGGFLTAALAGVLYFSPSGDITVDDPLVVANFGSDQRKEIVYREALGEGTYGLFIVNGQYVGEKTNQGYPVTDKGKQLARGLPGGASVRAEDFNGDGNLDLAISNGNQYDVLLGDGNLGFALAPPGTIAKRR